jgi:HSP20 family protein
LQSKRKADNFEHKGVIIMIRKEPLHNETGKPLAERQEWGNPFAVFRKEMDTLMESFLGRFDAHPFIKKGNGSFMPRIDVVDTDKEIRVSAELPGIDEKEIDVSVTREALTIKGEKKEEKEEKGKDYYRSERSYGSFSRTIPLPVEIDIDKISASFKKGVLTIRLPKTTQALDETKKITVTAE